MENQTNNNFLYEYKVGMTCNGCRNNVEKTLAAVPGVKNAQVDLEKSEAQIETDSHIQLETFQHALKNKGGHYSIHAPDEKQHHHHAGTAGHRLRRQVRFDQGDA